MSDFRYDPGWLGRQTDSALQHEILNLCDDEKHSGTARGRLARVELIARELVYREGQREALADLSAQRRAQ